MQKVKSVIDPTTQQNIDAWLSGNYDSESKDKVKELQRNHPEELVDAFYTKLSFGTGGLRGKMGVGTNRMNIYTVRAATKGLSNYLHKVKTSKDVSVFIGYDNRNNSRLFAEETAKVLAANGIKAYLCADLRPVGIVSFGVQYKKCQAGVMITASHNPPEYNGYKVYWDYGGQVLHPHDYGIIEEVNKITDPTKIEVSEFKKNPLIVEVGDEVDRAFLEAIRPLQLNHEQNRQHGANLKIAYTSLHGTGITMVPQAFSDWGFRNVTIVESQRKTDGDFPTVKSPNPEEPKALALGIETLKQIEGDLLFATDPDCDRLAIVVMQENIPVLLNGNEIACLALDYICHTLTERKKMPPKAMFIKTIVTTELFKAIVDHYGATCLDVLTGFKYIGEKIGQWADEEKAGKTASHHFIFGGEESFGYLYGTVCRDKDAIVSSALLAEVALHHKLQGKTLVDALYDLYHKYGVYREKLLSFTFEGKEGMEKIHKVMQNLRKKPPKALGDHPVVLVEDYLNHTSTSLETGHKETLVLPKSDVIRLWLDDRTRIVVRPSGTEPKLKIYCMVIEKHFVTDKKAITKAIESCDKRVDEILSQVKKELGFA